MGFFKPLKLRVTLLTKQTILSLEICICIYVKYFKNMYYITYNMKYTCITIL